MKTLIGILTIVGIAFGAYFYMEDRYALSEDLRQTQQRLDYKIVADQLKVVQERIWKIEDRCLQQKITVPSDPTIKEELRELKDTKERLQKKLEVMEKK